MTKQEKNIIIKDLVKNLEENSCFYVTNAQGLTANQINDFRRNCHEKGLNYIVIKNTLLKKAISEIYEGEEYSKFSNEVLKENTALLLTNKISGEAATIIKQFRKEKETELPILKGAMINGDTFVGNQNLEELTKLKSKEELIAEVVALLQSPVKNLVSALKSGQNKLTGILKALEKKES